MKKALIHYFSGTGNSLHAAKLLGSDMAKYGYDTVFHAVEDGIPDIDATYSLHIFFFPIYATAVPHIMLKYIRNLSNGKNVNAAVISTNGRISTVFRDGYQGWALQQARLCLMLRNYNVFVSDTLDYPHNITVFIPPRTLENNRKIIKPVSERISAIAEKVANVQKFHRGIFWPNIVWSVPFGIVYSFFARHIIGKMFATDAKCNLCRLCVKNCPVKAIDCRNGQISWKWNCEGCMRCINSCPRHAIQTSAVRVVAALALSSLDYKPLISKIVPDSFLKSLGDFGSAVFNTLLDLALFISSLILLDWIFSKISRINVIKKAIGWGHTRYYGRYNANQVTDK